MADMLKRLMTVEIKKVEDRILEIAGSTEDKDRMGDIIRADGWKLKHFKKNPVFLWVHDYSKPPIGKALRVWIDKETNKLMFKIEFAGPEVYEFADTIYKLYLGGFLHATSVGFIPLDWEGKSEEQPYPPWGEAIYTSQELLELSAVPVPANANALVEARDQGFITVKEFETMLDREDPRYYVGIIPEPVEPLQITSGEENPNPINEEDVLTLETIEAMWHKLEEYSELEASEKPFPNEHACRLKDPGQYDTCRRGKRTATEPEGVKGKEYSVIFCKKTGGSMEEQSYRYDKEDWTVAQARSHCKAHDGKFEAASTESQPEPRAISQEELADELDYISDCIEQVGLGPTTKHIAFNVVRDILRLTGNDIPEDIMRQIKAVIGEIQEAPALLPIPDPLPDPLPDPRDLLLQRAHDVAEVTNLVIAKLKGKRIPK